MKKSLIATVVTVVLIGWTAVGVREGWAAPPKYGGTLRIAFEADVAGFDPAVPSLQNYYVNQNLFNTLVRMDEKFEFVPELAESWDIERTWLDKP